METSEDAASCQRWRRSCGRPAHFAVQRASRCRSLMVCQGCTRCGDSQAAGVGEGEVGLMAAAVGEEVCTEESRDERGRHWLKETSYSL